MWRILAIVFFVLIAVQNFWLVRPLFDAEGELTEGSYRGIEIGDTKAELISKLNFSRLKLRSYDIGGKSGCTWYQHNCEFGLREGSTGWTLLYPSYHNEMVLIYFSDDRVVKIKYYSSTNITP